MNIFRCAECGRDVYEGEEYYDIDDTCLCEECGPEWLETLKRTVPVDRGDYIPLRIHI